LSIIFIDFDQKLAYLSVFDYRLTSGTVDYSRVYLDDLMKAVCKTLPAEYRAALLLIRDKPVGNGKSIINSI